MSSTFPYVERRSRKASCENCGVRPEMCRRFVMGIEASDMLLEKGQCTPLFFYVYNVPKALAVRAAIHQATATAPSRATSVIKRPSPAIMYRGTQILNSMR